MADVFVSYKREDKHLAEDVIHRLKEAGISVWYDERITPHTSWDETIEQEIATAKAVLVLWTPRSVTSQWVRTEADYGAEHGKMVPVKLEDCALPLAYRRMQTADLSNWDGDASSREWQKALGWVKSLVAGQGSVPDIGPNRPGQAGARQAAKAPKKKRGGMIFTVLALIALAGAGAAWQSGALSGFGGPSVDQIRDIVAEDVADVEPPPPAPTYPTCFSLRVQVDDRNGDGQRWDWPAPSPDPNITSSSHGGIRLSCEDTYTCGGSGYANPETNSHVNLRIEDLDLNQADFIGQGRCRIPGDGCRVGRAVVHVRGC